MGRTRERGALKRSGRLQLARRLQTAHFERNEYPEYYRGDAVWGSGLGRTGTKPSSPRDRQSRTVSAGTRSNVAASSSFINGGYRSASTGCENIPAISRSVNFNDVSCGMRSLQAATTHRRYSVSPRDPQLPDATIIGGLRSSTRRRCMGAPWAQLIDRSGASVGAKRATGASGPQKCYCGFLVADSGCTHSTKGACSSRIASNRCPCW